MTDPDDDLLDGCDLDFTEAPDDDDTAEMRPLFPDGVADEPKAAAWRRLGGSDA